MFFKIHISDHSFPTQEEARNFLASLTQALDKDLDIAEKMKLNRFTQSELFKVKFYFNKAIAFHRASLKILAA